MKMITTWKKFVFTLPGAALLLLLGGCALVRPMPDPTRFYILNTPQYEAVSDELPEGGVVMGMARVRVARYLDAPGLAIRENGNRITYSDVHRWAESLEHGVARMLAENLRQEPSVAHVVAYPAQRRPLPDYELRVSVLRAEGVIERTDASAVFHASWELRAGLDDEVVASGQVQEDDLPWDGEDFEQLTASLSMGAGALSQQVARAVEELR